MPSTKEKVNQEKLALIITIGFLIIIAVVGSLFVFGFISAYERNNQLKEKTYVRGFKVAIIGDMLSANNSRAQVILRLYNQDFNDLRELKIRYRRHTDDFENAVEGLQDLDDSAEQKKLMENIILQSNSISDLYQQGVKNISSNIDLVFKEDVIQLAYENLDQSIKNLLEYEQVSWFREVAEITNYNEENYKSGILLFWMVLLTCVLVAIVVLRFAKRAEKRLLKQKEYAQATLISIADGVITVNEQGIVTQINYTALKLIGLSEREAIGCQLNYIYRAKLLKSGKEIEHPANNPLVENAKEFPKIHYLFSKQKNIYEVEASYSLVKDNNQIVGAVIIFRDITESQEMSRNIKWQAYHDPLTGLMNRNSFEDKINLALKDISEQDINYSLLFMDLDRFKVVNDTCGHVAGDALLAQLGLIFEKQVRKTDCLARLGGDEFGLLLFNSDEETAYAIANKILKAINEFRFSWDDKVFSIGISIGFVIVDKNSTNLSELMSAADMACYGAKESGRGRVRKYDAEISVSALEMSMSTQISRAIDNNDFELYSQEIASLNNDGESVCEVLVRMKSANDLLLPNRFLPVAERFGLMCGIDCWVIDKLFVYIKEREIIAGLGYRYCINVSGESLNDDDFFTFLKSKIDEYEVDTQYLCFEITETVAITNLSKAAALIGNIKNLGCTIALDDFGTGASSFAYLKYLSVDYIKIDGTFIKDILDDELDLEIVKSIVNIAKVLDIKTVAEFVENNEILERVKSLGLDYAQGYAIDYPQLLSAQVSGKSLPYSRNISL